jgi:hypothetical protein
LSEQDQGLWDRNLIIEGQTLLSAALPQGAMGDYQIQAAIAAVHDEAETARQSDWPQILVLYTLLERATANPMVTLNRAIAATMVHAPPQAWHCSTDSTHPGRPPPPRRRAGTPARNFAGDIDTAIKTAGWRPAPRPATSPTGAGARKDGFASSRHVGC